MELHDAVRARYSCRHFDPGWIMPRGLLAHILQAAIHAPTGCNQQELRYQVLRDPHPLYQAINAAKRIRTPSIVLAIYADRRARLRVEWRGNPRKERLMLLDAGIAAQTIMLAAAAAGVASCMLNVFSDYDEGIQAYCDEHTRPGRLLLCAVALGMPGSSKARAPAILHQGRQVARHDLSYSMYDSSRTAFVSHLPDNAQHNLGCRAYVAGLHHLFSKHWPSCEICPFEHEGIPYLRGTPQTAEAFDAAALRRIWFWTAVTRRIPHLSPPVQRWLRRFSDYGNKRKGAFERIGGAGERMRVRMERFRVLSEADLFVLNGNGYICEAYRSFAWSLILEMRVAQLLGKPTIATNFTYDIEDPHLAAATLHTLRHASYVAVREPVSLARLHDCGVTGAVLAPDAALANPPHDPPPHPLLEGRDLSRTCILALRGDMPNDLPRWTEVLLRLRRDYQFDVLFLTTAPVRANASETSDLRLAHQLASTAPLQVIDPPYTLEQVLDVFRRTRYMISQRYHANVFALSCGTPFIPLVGNSRKTHGLCQILGEGFTPISSTNPTLLDELFGRIQDLESRYDSFKCRLAAVSRALAEESVRNLPDLSMIGL